MSHFSKMQYMTNIVVGVNDENVLFDMMERGGGREGGSRAGGCGGDGDKGNLKKKSPWTTV